jgi:hypothetical protein
MVAGPATIGLIILTLLSDNAPAPGDLYQQFVGKLKVYLRVAYELSFFVVVWVGGYQIMVLKRDLMIMCEAATTGTFTAQIKDYRVRTLDSYFLAASADRCQRHFKTSTY